MVKEYTIAKLAEILGISKQATDNKVKKLKEKGFKVEKRLVNNRPTTFIYLTDEQLSGIINNTAGNQPDQQYTNNNNQQVNNNQQQPQQIDNQLVLYIADLSAKASKYEMIEDKSKEDKENTKFWQDKYFESENEVKKLIKLNTQLETENQQLKKKGLFSWLKK
jgi:DNA-binding MarR family transcriptional regulator